MSNTHTTTLGATYRDAYTGDVGTLVFLEDGGARNRTAILQTGAREVATVAYRLEPVAPATAPVAVAYERLTGPTLGGIVGLGIVA